MKMIAWIETTYRIGIAAFAAVWCAILGLPTKGEEIQLRLATRHDVSDDVYVGFGEEFPAVGRLIVGNRACSGTLVKSVDGTWKVLAAAHCLDRNFDNEPDVAAEDVSFQLGADLNGPVAIATDLAVNAWNLSGGMDMSVTTLGEFDAELTVIPMTVTRDSPLGSEIVMAGFGTHGTGLPPFENIADELRRAASNMADVVHSDGELAGQIRTDFDHPENPTFSTLGEAVPTSREGTSGVGDSGGPMIYDGKVVGVLHGGINPTGFGLSEYGDVSIFAGTFFAPNIEFLRSSGVLVTGEGTSATAVSMDYIAQPGQPFVATEEGAIADGNQSSDWEPLPEGFSDGSDLLAVAQQWLPFGETEIRTLAGQEGRFSGSKAGDGTGFAGKKAYWWILETADGSAPDKDLSNVTAWGLFSSSSPNWKYPTLGLPPPQNGRILSSSEVDEAMNEGAQIEPDRLVLAKIAGFVLTYETWAQTAFPAEVPAEQRAPDANPDGDPFTNKEEWILAFSPIVREFDAGLEVTRLEERVIVTYQRQRHLPEGTQRVEFSSNLRNWQSALAGSEVIEIVDQTTEQVTLTFDQTPSVAYWRLAFP